VDVLCWDFRQFIHETAVIAKEAAQPDPTGDLPVNPSGADLSPRLMRATALFKACRHWRRQLWGTGARAVLDFQLFNFSGHLRAAQTLTFDSLWLPIE